MEVQQRELSLLEHALVWRLNKELERVPRAITNPAERLLRQLRVLRSVKEYTLVTLLPMTR